MKPALWAHSLFKVFFFFPVLLPPDAHSKRLCAASSNSASPHAPGSSPQLHHSDSPLVFICHFMHFSNHSLPCSPSLSRTLWERLSHSLSFGKGLASRHVLSCDVRRSRVTMLLGADVIRYSVITEGFKF